MAIEENYLNINLASAYEYTSKLHKKLDGVGPVDNRLHRLAPPLPPPKKINKSYIRHATPDT